MCIIACEAVGGKAKDALPAAAAIEMLHNATLIEDDIEDDSEERRGKPCLHRIYGIPLAINAGDVLYFSSFLSIAKVKSQKVREMLVKSFIMIGEGQAYDIGWREKNVWDISEEDYKKMVTKKTGALIGAACAAGAYLGGADDKVANALYEYGKSIGVAFQIQDDVLNLIGDVKKYGKEIGGDITEGKRTLMVVHSLNNGSATDKQRLIEILSSHTRDQKKINEAIEIIKANGSIDYAINYAREIVMKSKRKLQRIKFKNKKAAKILFDFADFFINREF